MAIPRIIHQIYLSGWDALPSESKTSIAKLRLLNPDWEYRFYDSRNSEKFIKQYFGDEMLSTFRKIHPHYYACRADLLRYLICFQFGGVYLDIKSTARTPLSSVIESTDKFLIAQWPVFRDKPPATQKIIELQHIQGGEFINWLLVCEPKHAFLEAVISQVIKNINCYKPIKCGVGKSAVLRLTGPVAYTLAIHPLLQHFSHRFIEYEHLGIEYSQHGDVHKHKKMYGKHYSEFVTPVIHASLFSTFLCICFFGFLMPKITFIRWKFNGLRLRLGL